MLYLVSNSSWRVSVSKVFFNTSFIHGLIVKPPPPHFSARSGCIYTTDFVQAGRVFFKEIALSSSLWFGSHCCCLRWPGLDFWIKLSEKWCSNPNEPQLLRGHCVLCINFFAIQILSDCYELLFNADTTSAADAKIWMLYFKSVSTSAKERAIINVLLHYTP